MALLPSLLWFDWKGAPFGGWDSDWERCGFHGWLFVKYFIDV